MAATLNGTEQTGIQAAEIDSNGRVKIWVYDDVSVELLNTLIIDTRKTVAQLEIMTGEKITTVDIEG